MTTHVALLRGINLAGRNRVPMADLRRIMTELGLGDVRTYIASGNAVFTTDRDDRATIGSGIRDRLSAELDLAPTVVVLTADELRAIADANPYAAAAEDDPTKVHVGFLSDVPADPAAFAFDRDGDAPEAIALVGRAIYLHLPDGMGRSPLAEDLARRKTDVEVTLRNWRTVGKLLEMIED